MRIAAGLTIAMLLATSTHADEPAAKTATGCMATAETQYDMNVCSYQDFKKADAKLNALYRQMMQRYRPTDQTLLKDAERKWLAYRDSECAFDSNGTIDGSFHPTSTAMCLTEKTEEHVKELKSQLDCPEGDLGCNRPSK